MDILPCYRIALDQPVFPPDYYGIDYHVEDGYMYFDSLEAAQKYVLCCTTEIKTPDEILQIMKDKTIEHLKKRHEKFKEKMMSDLDIDDKLMEKAGQLQRSQFAEYASPLDLLQKIQTEVSKAHKRKELLKKVSHIHKLIDS